MSFVKPCPAHLPPFSASHSWSCKQPHTAEIRSCSLGDMGERSVSLSSGRFAEDSEIRDSWFCEGTNPFISFCEGVIMGVTSVLDIHFLFTGKGGSLSLLCWGHVSRIYHPAWSSHLLDLYVRSERVIVYGRSAAYLDVSGNLFFQELCSCSNCQKDSNSMGH